MKKRLLIPSVFICFFMLGCEKTSVEAPGTASVSPGGLGGGTDGGDNGGGTNGGDNGGNNGGDTGGDNGGNNGGDTGGDNGGDNGGDTGGDNGGDTGGDNGGDNGGDTGGDNGGDGVGDGIADISKPSDWPSFHWDGKHSNARKWNDYTFDAIDSDGLNLVDNNPTDINEFCPNYPNLNESGKAMFWIGMLSAMGKYTSSWDPKTEFQEPFNDSSGNPAVSRGLMQIDFERAKNLGCPITNGQQLFGEKINLACAIKIMNHWVGRDKVVASKVNGSWRGGARFWSVLQKQRTRDPIIAMTKELAFCQK